MAACVEVGNWETLDDICNGIYEHKFDLTLNPPLLNSIFKTLNWMIEPLWKEISPMRKLLPTRFKGLKKPQENLQSEQA
mgnify:CR=1 FL=1|jgi:hypothetical protein